MIYTIIVFIMTLAEISTAAAGYLLESKLIFTNIVIYGSPPYMITNLLNRNSAFAERNPIYYALAAFHIIKYLCFIRSEITEERNIVRTTAILLEAAYLMLCAYYII